MKLLFAQSALLSAILFNANIQSSVATPDSGNDSGTPQSWQDGTCDSGYVTGMHVSTNSQGPISAMTIKCSSSGSKTVDTGVAPQLASPNHIDAPNGFHCVSEYRQTQAQDTDLLGIVAQGCGHVGKTTDASPQTFCCGPGKVVCGCKVKMASAFQQLEWKCCPQPGGYGDPQFIGFNGQSFQVHGMDNTVYNIISTPSLQFNALFTYLSKGQCRDGTLCFSHPGNYFGKVGISLKTADEKVYQLLIEAGPVKEGMKLTVDGVTISPSQNHLTMDSNTQLYLPSAFECYIESNEFSVKFENSDMFLNQQVTVSPALSSRIAEYKAAAAKQAAQPSSLLSGLLTSVNTDNKDNNAAALLQQLPHGILGQTWLLKEYNNRWKYIEGQLFDYIVADGLNGLQFKFNRFHAAVVTVGQP